MVQFYLNMYASYDKFNAINLTQNALLVNVGTRKMLIKQNVKFFI